MTTTDQREEARYRQDVLVSYRAWLAYLEAQQTLLAASGETQGGIDPFEGLSDAQERAETARRRIAALPADKRELFDFVFEQERQQFQRQLDGEAQVRGGTVKRADPDEVARRALSHLQEGARGLHRDDRRGLVPRGKPDAVKWLALDLTDLEQAPPSETDYQLAAGRQAKRRSIIVNALFALLALIAIPGLIFLLQQPGQQASAPSLPTGNGASLSPWTVTAVGDEAGDWTVPVEAVTSRWPSSCADGQAEGQTEAGCWQQGSFRPLRLCLPAERLAELTALRVLSSEEQPARVFTLTSAATSGADLVVSPCAGETTEAPARAGLLRAVEPPLDLAPGEASPTGFRVTAMTTRGRGEDPDISEDYLTLTVILDDPDTSRDWPGLGPALLLSDGETVSPSDSIQDGAERRIEYLVPNQSEPFEVRWQVAIADQVVRYRATLEPPPSRDAVLRARLRVEDVAVAPSQQTMAVTLSLHNAATTPLSVEQADLGFQTQTARRDVAAPTLRQPLAPGERRTITVGLPLESGTLEVGPFRYQLAVRR